MSLYQENQDLISIGAYKKGTNQELDRAIEKMPKINKFLQQTVESRFSHEETLEIMKEIFE
jgi:flagellum-specific ATP synthase